jgi:hypothetical protein
MATKKASYQKDLYITTQEIAKLLKVRPKTHRVASFLTAFGITPVSHWFPEKSKHFLYPRADVLRAVEKIKDFEKGK